MLDSNAVAGWTHIASSSLVNEARFQWNYRNYSVRPNELNGPEFNVTGFGFFNRDIFLPSVNTERRYEAADNLVLSRGAHRFKFGSVVLIRGTKIDSQTFFSGRFGFGTLPGSSSQSSFHSTATGNPLSPSRPSRHSIVGLPQSYQTGFGDGIVASTEPTVAFYAQDSWNLRPNLTLNYGLRYELDDRREPLPTDKNNLAPRFGFAWDPWSNRKTVIRGGYGTFLFSHLLSDRLCGGRFERARRLPPDRPGLDHPQTEPLGRERPDQYLPDPESPGRDWHPPNGAHDHRGRPCSVRNRRITDRTAAAVDRAVPAQPELSERVFSTSQPGHRTRAHVRFQHLGQLHLRAHPQDHSRPRSQRSALVLRAPRGIPDWTAATGCTGAGLASCFRDPLLFQENVYESSGRAFYHGMIVEVSKRFRSHVSLAGSYTFSKAIDEVTDYNSDFQPNDQSNVRLERALSAFDQRHKFVIYSYLESPYRTASGNSLLTNILADFLLTPILRANSTRPFNLLVGGELNGDRHSTTDRPVFAGRNTGIGPNFWTFDMRLARRIGLGSESRNLELTFEAFNLFNRLNFASVNNTVGPSFAPPFNVKARKDVGPSVALGYTSAFDPRRIQLGFRLSF